MVTIVSSYHLGDDDLRVAFCVVRTKCVTNERCTIVSTPDGRKPYCSIYSDVNQKNR